MEKRGLSASLYKFMFENLNGAHFVVSFSVNVGVRV